MALGFAADGIEDRIYGGFAVARGYLLAEAIMFGEIYRDEADVSRVA